MQTIQAIPTPFELQSQLGRRFLPQERMTHTLGDVTMRVARACILDATEEYVLLCESARKRHWELPGGQLDPGETDEEAVIRETDEEAGIGISVIVPPRISEIRRMLDHPTLDYYIASVVLAQHSSGEPRPLSETSDLAWVQRQKVQEFHGALRDGTLPAMSAVGL